MLSDLKMKKLKCGCLVLVLCSACAFKQEERVDCETYSREANSFFECYLQTRQDSCLMLSLRAVNIALLCDSSRPANYWLKIRILSSKRSYDSALQTVQEFEKISRGPDLMFTKGELYRKLGNLDSAKLNYRKALRGYDELLIKDSTNASFILGKLQVLVYLDGKRTMLHELEVYRKRYGHLSEFRFLQEVPFLVDSIP